MIAEARTLELHNDSSLNAALKAARRLYCELLDGLEIPPEASAGDESVICFVVNCVVIETGNGRRRPTARVLVPVEDPETIAARCWNSGYTVMVDDVTGASRAAVFTVLDPFGLHIELDRNVTIPALKTMPIRRFPEEPLGR